MERFRNHNRLWRRQDAAPPGATIISTIIVSCLKLPYIIVKVLSVHVAEIATILGALPDGVLWGTVPGAVSLSTSIY
jgi:hypothetical protein